MKRFVLSIALAAGASVQTAGQSAQDAAQAAVREGVARRIYISATTGDGTAAADLSAQEVTVKEDGKTREVLHVGPATEPMQIVMLVDDSGPGINYVRPGVAQFIRILQNRGEFAIISTAGQNSVVTDFTSDVHTLLEGVNRLTTRTTSGGYVLDGIQEAARVLERREAVRPVIVVLALEGTEFSNVAADRVLDAVRRSRAVVHVLSVGKPTLKTMTSWNQRPTDSIHEALDETISRHTVLVEAPRRSGGRHEQVVQASGIQTRFAEIAYELRDQLAVTYARPASAKDGSRVEVGVKRRGIKVRAPRNP